MLLAVDQQGEGGGDDVELVFARPVLLQRILQVFRAQQLADQLVAWRRDIHMHPELSFQEQRTARLVADLVATAGADRFRTIDLHAGQIQGFFDIPGDELTAQHMLVDYFRERQVPNAVVVAPDIGASRRARNFAEELNLPLAIIEKRRMQDGSGTRQLNLIGTVDGSNAIIFDDEIDTGGTIAHAAHYLRERGAQEVYACATHAVLSPPHGVECMQIAGLKELVVTNTVYLSPEKCQALKPFLRLSLIHISEPTRPY